MKSSDAANGLFLTDSKGRRTAIVLDLPTYENLLQAKEELAEIEAYDAARSGVYAEIEAGQFTTLADYRAARRRKTK